MPRLIKRYANGSEIWADKCPFSGEIEYLVYGYYDSGDPKVCPSLSMAREYAE